MTSSQSVGLETCPACKAEEIERGTYNLEGRCTHCGFVIREDSDAPPDWLIGGKPSEGTQGDNWSAQSSVRNATEQRISRAFEKLEDICNRLGLEANLRRDAAEIYCDAHCAGTTDGRGTDCLVAACIRLASLQAQHPIPAARINGISEIADRDLRLAVAALGDDLDCELPTPTPVDYVPYLTNALNLATPQKQSIVEDLELVAGDKSLVGKNPAGIAAAEVYLAVVDATQSMVAEAVGVSSETIRVRSNQLEQMIDDAR